MVKQAKLKDVCHPPHELGELRSNISTYCALLFTLFGEGGGTSTGPIIWAIIVDTRLFFDDIKLAEDFIDQGHYMLFPVSRWRGTSCPSSMGSNFRGTTSHTNGLRQMYSPSLSTTREKEGGVAAITFPPVSLAALRAHGPSILHLPHQMRHRTIGGLLAVLTNAIRRLLQ